MAVQLVQLHPRHHQPLPGPASPPRGGPAQNPHSTHIPGSKVGLPHSQPGQFLAPGLVHVSGGKFPPSPQGQTVDAGQPLGDQLVQALQGRRARCGCVGGLVGGLHYGCFPSLVVFLGCRVVHSRIIRAAHMPVMAQHPQRILPSMAESSPVVISSARGGPRSHQRLPLILMGHSKGACSLVIMSPSTCTIIPAPKHTPRYVAGMFSSHIRVAVIAPDSTDTPTRVDRVRWRTLVSRWAARARSAREVVSHSTSAVAACQVLAAHTVRAPTASAKSAVWVRVRWLPSLSS